MLDAIAAEKARSADVVREFLPGLGVWSDELDGVLARLTQRGVLFMADYLRVGFFWGGDGEKNVKLDLINAQAHVVDDDQVRKGLGTVLQKRAVEQCIYEAPGCETLTSLFLRWDPRRQYRE